MINFNKRTLLYFILIVVAALLLYILQAQLKGNSAGGFTGDNRNIKSPTEKSNFIENPVAPAEKTLKTIDKPTLKNITKETAIKADEPKFIDGIDEGEKADIINWMESRGYFRSETIALYNSYSEATLEALAAQGDIGALQIIHQLRMLEGRREQGMDALDEAAMRGSVRAFVSISSYLISDMASQVDGPARDELGYKALAYMKVANMRGDKMIDDLFIEQYRSAANFNVTPEGQKIIDEYAKNIYRSLENDRINEGLGEFDNAIDPSVEKLYELAGKK